MSREGSALEERLERIENLLANILIRLERLESRYGDSRDVELIKLATELTLSFSYPAFKALKEAERLLSMLRRVKVSEPLSRVIVEVLSVSEGGLSITELTREVRRVRGTASKRIILEKLRELEAKGVVVVEKAGRRKVVRLRE